MNERCLRLVSVEIHWGNGTVGSPLDSDDRKGGGMRNKEKKREKGAKESRHSGDREWREGPPLPPNFIPSSSNTLFSLFLLWSMIYHHLILEKRNFLRLSNLLSGLPSSKPLIEVDRLMDWWKEEKLRLYGRMMSHRNYCKRLKWARNYNGEMKGRKRLLFSCSDCLYEWRERKS